MQILHLYQEFLFNGQKWGKKQKFTHCTCTKNSYFMVKSEAKKHRNSHKYWACTKNSYFPVKSEAKNRNARKLNQSITGASHDFQVW